jgi:hypothetical protein
MSMLAFFPWLELQQEVRTSAFTLVPYVRGESSQSISPAEQQVLDLVLEPYRHSLSTPIQRSAILRWGNAGLTDDIPDAEIHEAFECAELVAFTSLAAREFFNSIGWYANRDQLRLTIQEFGDPAGPVRVTINRRDGPRSIHLVRDAALVTRPQHAFSSGRATFDIPLLESLLARRHDANWKRFREAIIWFNAASTESPDEMDETEFILLVSAFERILDLTGGDDDALANAFTNLLVPSDVLPRSALPRTDPITGRAFSRATSLREVWIRDLYRMRGQFAHGHIEHGIQAYWRVEEHLLFASFVFPLVLRLVLRDQDSYALAERDLIQIDAFEQLISLDHFADLTEEEIAQGKRGLEWRTVLNAVMWKRAGARFIAAADPRPNSTAAAPLESEPDDIST